MPGVARGRRQIASRMTRCFSRARSAGAAPNAADCSSLSLAGRSAGVVGLLLLASGGCRAPAAHVIPAESIDRRILIDARDDSAHLYRVLFSGVRDSSRRVVRDSAVFMTLWRRLENPKGNALATPAIDFRRTDVIVVALGSTTSEGPMISVDSVWVAGTERTIVVRRFVPHVDCPAGVAYDASQPLDVVVVPRDTIAQTRFVERTEILNDCGPVSGRFPRRTIP
jgi:hypothetical protein